MSRFKRRATVGAVLTGCALFNMPSVMAQAVPGGTLDPLSIPKYVTPLVIPPVLHDDAGAPMSVEVALREISQQVLPIAKAAMLKTANTRIENASASLAAIPIQPK